MSSRNVSRTVTEALRSLVRAVLLEDVAQLKKWALGSYDPVERELAKLDIVPVIRGRHGDPSLGFGVFNRVYEVVYKGKRAAARFSSKPEEVESMLRFVSYRDKLPAQFRKHFPKVYKTFQFNLDGEPRYGTVMELLQPMPPGLEFDIDTMPIYANLQRSRVANVSNPSAVKALMPLGSPGLTKELLSFFKREVKPLLDGMIGKPLTDVEAALYELIEPNVDQREYKLFVHRVFQSLRNEVIPSGPGSNSSPAIAAKHPSKAVRDFMKFLQALKEQGLHWDDLHTGNFMMRPGTNDFVVADPGFFTEPGSVEYEDF